MDKAKANVYCNLRLYGTPDNFVVEPRSSEDEGLEDGCLVIDRSCTTLTIDKENNVPDADYRKIYGIVGIIRLIAGPYLIVITKAKAIGKVNGCEIYEIMKTDMIGIQNNVTLTDKQELENHQLCAMVKMMLSTDGLYFSYDFDLTHSMQRLQSTSPDWRKLPMHERADPRFTWNAHVLKDLSMNPDLSKYTMPILHGFVKICKCELKSETLQLGLISRRALQRAGTRFNMRGLDKLGYSANFVETEQIVQYKKSICAFVQIRGSIPLFWSQKPNFAWQPKPILIKSAREQVVGLKAHVNQLKTSYLGVDGGLAEYVIIDLVNTKGKEKTVGQALEDAVNGANIAGVKYYRFDFHEKCKNMQWHRLSSLITDLEEYSKRFKFFATTTDNSGRTQKQGGYMRTNCMDCLDRTNVVQSMLARESLTRQLFYLKLFSDEDTVTDDSDFESTFKNLWADNGDMCSIQYAGTGALKADFTRLGKRTSEGAMNDGKNALIRYYLNNFTDGFRQDAIDLFLGNYEVDEEDADVPLDKWQVTKLLHGVMVVLVFLFILNVLLETDYADDVFLCILLFLGVVWFNGEKLVSKPMLKPD